ncbi:MAG: hypothetical protein IPL09_05315 [Bacteroidetes bacterium]|nr:hypothetical protein [Bacteroidota bacterium]MBK7041030.1 hypothetical protein [Bacteroidota bacterium]MBK7587808.1 hypothetical protein [Bacteroidota bacterium]MBK8328885.1 hypothetical protein [Bacteroidota bacterium]MBK9302206.1 hypothetical protein [Bacteroidota bacterium]
MVIIFSDCTDFTTTHVIYWLCYYKLNFKVITPETKIEFKNFSIKNFILMVNGEEICSTKIKGFWYRRGELTLEKLNYIFGPNDYLLQNFLEAERRSSLSYIYTTIENISAKIGSFWGNSINRLDVLTEASYLGLVIPKFLVTNSKFDLRNFYISNKPKGIVLKNFSEGVFFQIEDIFYKYYTKKIDNSFIKNIPNKFPPCLFMEYFDKLFEIRAFVLFDKVFSMVIINSEDTVDIKKSEKANKVRYSPFILPKGISSKLVKLVKQLKIQSGSVDLLVNKNGDFCFLEINPIGQFGHLSRICNLNLEKLIAKYFYEQTSL